MAWDKHGADDASERLEQAEISRRPMQDTALISIALELRALREAVTELVGKLPAA